MSNFFAGLSQLPSPGPWFLNSDATNHVSGNESFLSKFSIYGCLPTVTLANGSKTQFQKVGTAHPLPSLSANFVLYVSGSLFNLLSISCLTRSLS